MTEHSSHSSRVSGEGILLSVAVPSLSWHKGCACWGGMGGGGGAAADDSQLKY